MYNILKFIENINRYLKIKTKILYWKLKYGKRIKIGNNFKFRKRLIINISQNGYLEIGNNNAFNNNCSINCHKKIKIGNNNMFGENVKFYDHNHIFNNKNIDMTTTFKEHEILIGDNNWIASDVVFLSKATLGDNNVVGIKTVINEKYANECIIRSKIENINEKIIYIGEWKWEEEKNLINI